MRALISAAAAALAACVSTPPPPAPSFYVVRHLQKESGEDPGLTEEGRRCAASLAAQLADSGVTAVYASTTRRARETGAPLATRLGLAVSEYDPRDTPGLAGQVGAQPGSVLVVGHSNTVPAIVEALGGARPGDLAEDRYGDLWRVTRNGGATGVSRIDGC